MIITRGLGDNSLLITRGYGTAIFVELVIKVLPEFITRRASFENIVSRLSITRIVRREND
jgi:hypothetical protein